MPSFITMSIESNMRNFSRLTFHESLLQKIIKYLAKWLNTARDLLIYICSSRQNLMCLFPNFGAKEKTGLKNYVMKLRAYLSTKINTLMVWNQMYLNIRLAAIRYVKNG